jgi:hypothetical protein
VLEARFFEFFMVTLDEKSMNATAELVFAVAGVGFQTICVDGSKNMSEDGISSMVYLNNHRESRRYH